MKWLEEKIREVEQATDQCGRETEAKIGEEVRRRFDMQMKETKREWVPRVDLERAHKNIEALEKRLSSNEEAFKVFIFLVFSFPKNMPLSLLFPGASRLFDKEIKQNRDGKARLVPANE